MVNLLPKQIFVSLSFFQRSLADGFQFFLKSNRRYISQIIFIITFGLERTSELFCRIQFYLPFTEILEFGTDLRSITWTRLCFNFFGSINFLYLDYYGLEYELGCNFKCWFIVCIKFGTERNLSEIKNTETKKRTQK